jgi:energy-coupling factor transporter ATP-binding protein EcfA2
MRSTWSRGSEWHRWDPHLHTPATALNNQFGGDWAAYLDAIERASPTVEAVGVTDYCTIIGYKEFRAHQAAGRIANVRLAFPNVEFRLDLQTEKKRGINIHLLFSPDDPNHVREIERALLQLTFEYKGTTYHCSPEALIELGRAIAPEQTDPAGALKVGVEQFKLDFKELRRLFDKERWVRQNCLVAVEVSEGDGTAGLQKDSAFKAVREEIEAFSHAIFSPRESDRDFWLGRKPGMDRDFIERTYRSLKPCLHGSDAHRLDAVLKPEKDRYCWISADLTFMGLKQTLLEPAARVHIGAQPPAGPGPSDCIAAITIGEAPWLETQTIELNRGLVAIIGPKGSGKTALADIIAQAAGAPIQDESSFLLKAGDLLGKGDVIIRWGDDAASPGRRLADTSFQGVPLVRYLSQQSVDRLCSAEGILGELLDEIEAVVFQAIPDDERLGATSFAELRAIRLEELHEARDGLLDRIHLLTEQIAGEEEKRAKIPSLSARHKDLADRLKKSEKDLNALLPKEKKDEVKLLGQLQDVCTAKEKELQSLRLAQTKLEQLGEAVGRIQTDWQRSFETLRHKYRDCNIEEGQWDAFRPTVSPEGPKVLAETKAVAQKRIDQLVSGDPARPKDPAHLSTWPLTELRERMTKLTAEIGVEKDRTKKHLELQRFVSGMKLESDRMAKEIEDAKLSDGRRKKAVEERRGAYAQVFDLFAREQAILEQLYAPLRTRLAAGEESARRLGCHVQRTVDLERWVSQGEELLDLRKQGPFQGRGRLSTVAKEKLLPAWRAGDAAAVAAAMQTFLEENMRGLIDSRASHVGLQDLGRWLFSTDHVSLTYGVRYDEVEISRLSPGMRGIVLLILYLAIDQWDLRPLVVDQPEENLDPQSVYDELVRYFRAAKQRRQVILVTHNPNLVVNADADQVIVAHAAREGSGLPRIRYTSGGLEDAATRNDVCRILEGGERAFREREHRYAFPEDPRFQGA